MNHLARSVLIFTLATLLYSDVHALPGGAPKGTCISMAPSVASHGDPQTGVPPYVIQVDKSYYGLNSTVKVYIKACGDAIIGGFLIEAREKGQTKALGRFMNLPDDTKALDCDDADSSEAAVTHSTILSVKMLEFQWRPVAATMATENIYFVATVAQNRPTYWLGVKSVELERETQGKMYAAPNNPMCPGENDGKDGNDGENGNDGKDGSDGKDENEGQDGNDGNEGKEGNDGKNGDDGNSASSATFSVTLILLAIGAKFFV